MRTAVAATAMRMVRRRDANHDVAIHSIEIVTTATATARATRMASAAARQSAARVIEATTVSLTGIVIVVVRRKIVGRKRAAANEVPAATAGPMDRRAIRKPLLIMFCSSIRTMTAR